MWRTLYSGHLSIADIIFRSEFTLPPRTDLPIANTPNNRPYIRHSLYVFCLRQCFTVSFKFSSIFIILFFSKINVLFRFTKIKLRRDFRSVLAFMVDAFPNCKNVQSTTGGRIMDTIIEIFVALWPPPFLYSENKYKPQYSFPLYCWLFHIANTHQPVASKLSYKHDIL